MVGVYASLAAVLALLIGGSIAAPVAAWIVTRLNPAALGGVVGTLLVVLNLPAVLAFMGVEGPAVWVVRGLVLAVGLTLSWVGARRARRNALDAVVVTGVDVEPAGGSGATVELAEGRVR